MLSSADTERRYRVVFDRYHQDVYAYFKRRIEPETAKDCTAETFLVAWKRIDKVPEGDEALPWLYRVARNVLRNEYRAKRRSRSLSARIGGNGGDPVSSPEVVVVRREEDEETLAALRRLSAQDQEILLLAVWEELPYEEIAGILDCTPHAASQRLYRASQRLAKQLGRKRPARTTQTNPTGRQKEG
ncbi:MAG: sigma-70 family RNA polymerase sigma factor [Actinomycetia bacterium]|nr:sigma-70 family RNA polymerase sigma factor [Actinomycetes bacterium]